MSKIRDLVCENAECAANGVVLSDQWVETIAGQEVDQACDRCHRALAHALSPIHIGAGSGGREKSNKPENVKMPHIETTPVGNFDVYAISSPGNDATVVVDAKTNSAVAFGRHSLQSGEGEDPAVHTCGLIRKDFQAALVLETQKGGNTEKLN